MTMTAAQVLALADSQIGTGEFPPGSNKQKYARETGLPNGVSWCAIFICWLMQKGSVVIPAKARTASSRTMYAEAVKAGLGVKMNAIRQGDVVHMSRGPRNKWLGHVGIVERVLPNGMVETVEGNTNGKGSATGGSVLRHTRKLSAWNLGAWRPKLSAPIAPPTVTRFLWKLDDGRIVQPTGLDSAVHLAPVQVEALLAAGWVQQVHHAVPKVLS